MKSVITIILCLLLLIGFSQNNTQKFVDGLPVLSSEDQFLLKNLPVKTLPDNYAARSLPMVVDNSQFIYMRPAFNQAHYSCGQASLIGYNFTYEMARKRDVSANNINNQYPTHFAWNFMNGGNGYYGVSYLHSAQILKFCGTPSVAVYGGMAAGGYERWMSGYENYLSAMENRITSISQIPVGTEEELQTLKYWLYDHHEGSEYGGLASFYAQYLTVNQTLPAGTPEAGKYVITSFGGSPNHAMTIVGYNDEIRWDYNNDGQYTNHIDINNDGVVNMKDWEIGGFKMVQSYGGVPNWGDQGYAYMMYKTVADRLGQGGIWNHCVHVLDVKEAYEPQLVAKINLKHDRRTAVKVIVGVSNSINADSPEFIFDSPIVDFQGGDNYMQGGETEADKTIEYGLDLSPLLTNIQLDQQVKFFMQVVENDPWYLGNGEIISFSVIDYTNGTNEVVSPQNNVTIIDNDTTTVTLLHTISFDRVEIDTDILPEAIENEPYSFQMEASGGVAPYFWDFDKTYEETTGMENFVEIDELQLYPSNNSSGIVTHPLDFDFPFYDSIYSSVTLHVDGYLMFDEQLYPYPYFNDDNVLFKSSRNISPFMTQLQQIYTSYGCGLWYEGNENSATFRWKTMFTDDFTSILNYSVTLFPDGKIKFNYGEMIGFEELEWIGGVSDDDFTNYTFTSLSDGMNIPENYQVNLFKYEYPEEMSITAEGLLYGTPTQSYNGSAIKFRVTDNSFVSDSKELFFTSNEIEIQVEDYILSGDDDIVEYGETATISFEIFNSGEVDLTNVVLTISSDSEFVTILDNQEVIGDIEAGGSIFIPDCVSFSVHNNVPNGRVLNIDVNIVDDHTGWEIPFSYPAFAPEIEIDEVYIDDENGLLDPGETTDIALVFLNDGGAGIDELTATLSTQNPLITINSANGVVNDLAPDNTDTLLFNISVAETAMSGEEIEFLVAMEGTLEYENNDNFTIRIGLNEESFESGDFSLINWGYKGEAPWQIDSYFRYEGQYSARSGFIIDQQSSTLMADVTILAGGNLSFYKKVSCESDNADNLTFYINGVERDTWSGQNNWDYHEYYLEPGFYRLEWTYQKNESVSENMDGAWIDMISFPAMVETPPSLTFDHSSVAINIPFDQMDIEVVTAENVGEENIHFSTFIASNDVIPASQERNIQGSYIYCNRKIVNSGESYQMLLTVYNASMDNEWIEEIQVELPTGVTLVNASNFSGGSEDLVFEGELGDGATAVWHGEDINGWGVLQGGNAASATVDIWIDEDFTDQFTLSYIIRGDTYGDGNHEMYGDLAFRNLGDKIDWIFMDQEENQLDGGQSGQINLNINTWGLDVGLYTCNILVIDNFYNEYVIPVSLEVEQYVELLEHKNEAAEIFTGAYPNPFTKEIVFSLNIVTENDYTLEIFDLQSRRVRTLLSKKLERGTHTVRWDGKAEEGSELTPGVYLCIFSNGDKRVMKRVIKQ